MNTFLQKIVVTPTPNTFLEKFFREKEYSKVALLVDENTEKNCYPIIRDNLPDHTVVRIASGEASKTFSTCLTLWTSFMQEEMDRHAVIVILGGGVLGDMGGFCAATFKRGVDFVFIPTTLLAQADAAIGGKLGVNLDGHKNQIGLFKTSCVTLISPLFLATLPRRVLLSGFAEIVKHYLIADIDGWHGLQKIKWNDYDWHILIQRSIDIKMRLVQQDPYERGVRKVLNFGHTIGHAIERHFYRQGLLHGEAVAIGMIVESHISCQKKYIGKAVLVQITQYILSLFEKQNLPDIDPIFENIKQDKKNKNNRIMMTLLKSIGCADWNIEVDKDEVYNALMYYRSL